MKIAIVGGGISGMACAYFLKDHFDITLFEKKKYLGGHTNPITIQYDQEEITFDSAFMVFNEVNYPRLVRFFKKLNVETVNTSMSLSIRNQSQDLEYSGSGFNGLFGQRKNLFKPWYYKFLLEIHRFNQLANQDFDTGNIDLDISLKDYLDKNGFSAELRNLYLLPMTAAIWSSSPQLMLEFPIRFLIRFLKNHGLLGLNSHFQWKTVKGTSKSYRDKILVSCKEQIQINEMIQEIKRKDNKIYLKTKDHEELEFDKVIVATHADQAYELLANPTKLEVEVLRNFDYRTNPVMIHKNPKLMPKMKRNWSSWNVLLNKGDSSEFIYSATYYMNMLQQLNTNLDIFVTIDPPVYIPDEDIFMKIKYDHPIFNLKTHQAKQKMPELKKQEDIYYCGSYHYNGFHEDGLRSALDVCEALLGYNPL